MFRQKWPLMMFAFLLGFLTAAILLAPSFVLGDVSSSYAPGNYLQPDQIHVYSDQVRIDVKGAIWGSFTDSGSMQPFLDQHAHTLQYVPERPEDIHQGDIISFVDNYGRQVVHRVTYIGVDEHGRYYRVKGDSNFNRDEQHIRFEDIHSIVFAILY